MLLRCKRNASGKLIPVKPSYLSPNFRKREVAAETITTPADPEWGDYLSQLTTVKDAQRFEERHIDPDKVISEEQVDYFRTVVETGLQNACLRIRKVKEDQRQHIHQILGIQNGGFHASQFHLCCRRIFYDMIYTREEREEIIDAADYLPPDMKGDVLFRLFDIGDYIHERIQRLMRVWQGEAKGIECSPEHPIVSVESNTFGRTDAILVIDEYPFVYEIKSMKTEMYDRFIAAPLKTAARQACFYGEQFGIRQAIIHHENKNTHEWSFFVCRFDELDFLRIQTDKDTVMKAIELGKPPLRHKLCLAKAPMDFCPYGYVCWGE